MIFATVGSQMPFDRLISALDNWAATRRPAVNILAQIGQSDIKPGHMQTVFALSPSEFRVAVSKATVIVAHAGMGSVLTAMEFGKPLVVMPRQGKLRETRNDHQVATAKWLSSKPGVYVALLQADFNLAINRALNENLTTKEITQNASPELIGTLQRFISS